MKKETFDICVDDDNVDILDWIRSHFDNGNWHKHFEITVSVRGFDWNEEGEKFYTD
ncbi:hypothetical protein [Bacillus phage vB_BanS-Thrax5]|nr:hypothetical protein [Bacillus phage vB_BanS-Thrax5]